MQLVGDTAEALDAQAAGKPSSTSKAAAPGVPAQASKGIDQGTCVDSSTFLFHPSSGCNPEHVSLHPVFDDQFFYANAAALSLPETIGGSWKGTYSDMFTAMQLKLGRACVRAW